jgi:phasin family protein
MTKVEEFQQYGKEQFDAAVASANSFSAGLQSIANAYGDYAKKSFEDTKAHIEKLSGVKSIEKAVELQTEFAKSSYETFVAESQKIGELYGDLAKQAFKPFETFVSKFSSTAVH